MDGNVAPMRIILNVSSLGDHLAPGIARCTSVSHPPCRPSPNCKVRALQRKLHRPAQIQEEKWRVRSENSYSVHLPDCPLCSCQRPPKCLAFPCGWRVPLGTPAPRLASSTVRKAALLTVSMKLACPRLCQWQKGCDAQPVCCALHH